MSPKSKVTGNSGGAMQRRVWLAEQQRGMRVAAEIAYHKQHRRRMVATALFILSPVMALFHLLEHLRVVTLPVLSSGWQDLLIGWPMAAVLLIIGGMLWGV